MSGHDAHEAAKDDNYMVIVNRGAGTVWVPKG